MDFQMLLLHIGNNLQKAEVQSLNFLCTDILRQSLSSVESASDLFTRLLDQDHLSAKNPQLLADLLFTIKRTRLVREFGLNDYLSTTQSSISPYRKLLYNLSEEITDDDLKHMKFLLSRKLPRTKLEKNMTTLDVFLAMERMDLLGNTKLNLLEELLKNICPTLNDKIKEFEESQECNTSPIAQEMGRPRSMSYPLLPNQAHSSYCSVNLGMCQTSGTELSKSYERIPPSFENQELLQLSSVNLSNTSVDDSRVSDNTAESLSHDLRGLSSGGSNCESFKEKSVFLETLQSAENQTSLKKGLGTYPMTSAKRGICLIINNYDFSGSIRNHSNREGTMYDENILMSVFKWLGFEMKIKNDCTRKQILSTLEELSKRDHSEVDCLACCVLSHGAEGSVYGVDGETVKLKELMGPFDGLQCPSLVEKPKMFFIQACQGTKEQKPVVLQADGPSPVQICTDADALNESIPSEADILMGMATVPSCVSYRERSKGTWFIQSLCQHLVQMVPQGIDLVSILTQVNADVSQKSSPCGQKKQMPQPAFSLRKKIVFPVPRDPPPIC
ncbi:caspase-8 isoform X2 [Thalassophryne amazonica]|uniref:caspase-8 isoform X2 n=1 Tax=Thalassophryne amazonica TaxID=390379 RepID=UPI0014715156|nr:caspase-8 isoform X2 [Thalassophryne amazonica]